MQNKGHISAVNDYFKNKYKDCFYSYIVFSERCELKKISVTSSNIFVLKRNALYHNLKNQMTHLPEILTQEQVSDIYQKLKAKTLADADTKQQHIDAIKSKHYQ